MLVDGPVGTGRIDCENGVSFQLIPGHVQKVMSAVGAVGRFLRVYTWCSNYLRGVLTTTIFCGVAVHLHCLLLGQFLDHHNGEMLQRWAYQELRRFSFIILMQRMKMVHQRKLEAARELYGLSPTDEIGEDALKMKGVPRAGDVGNSRVFPW